MVVPAYDLLDDVRREVGDQPGLQAEPMTALVLLFYSQLALSPSACAEHFIRRSYENSVPSSASDLGYGVRVRDD